MGSKSSRHVLLLAAACALQQAGCTSAPATIPPTEDVTTRTYVVAGATGSAVAGSQPGTLEVTIENVDPTVDWYVDRPVRSTGEEPATRFVEGTWGAAYGTTRPWVLVHLRAGPAVQGIHGRMAGPRHDAAARRLTFSLEVGRSTFDVSGGVGSFQAPVLTIQPNLRLPEEGSAFALHGASARVEPDGAGGQRLVLSGVGSRAFAVNGAPGPVGDSEDVAAFVDRWDERFGHALPNASVAGDVGGGAYELLPLSLAAPVHDPIAGSVTFSAVPVSDPGAPALSTVLTGAVLHVDGGARLKASTLFDRTWRGVAYSAIRSGLTSVPRVKASEAWDSDVTSDNFQAQWGSRGDCARRDLEVMAAKGVNLVRLYDYNYARDAVSPVAGSAGKGHLAFLDEAQRLGIKVIIPVSTWNFSNDRWAWDSIDNTVRQIVNSTKKDGSIHPAVHSFSVGNELDLPQYGLSPGLLLSRGVQVVGLIHQLAPDHYVTIPISNAREQSIYALFKSGGTLDGVTVGPIPAPIYGNRFFNSVQTFKLGGDPDAAGNDLRTNILEAYDAAGLGVPLLITELGRNLVDAGLSSDAKVEQVLGQARTARAYLDRPGNLFRGFAIFEWQNSDWKRNDGPPNSESTFGIHDYDGVLCSAQTGPYVNQQGGISPSARYDVDRLKELTSPAHPEGLLTLLQPYLR